MKLLRIIRKSLPAVLLAFLGYVILGTALPFLFHREVTQEFQERFVEEAYRSDQPGPERVAYIGDNTEALITRLQMLEEAEQEIILSTFDFDADEAGKDMMAALMHAADRGVRVRVLVDGFSGFLDVQGSEWFRAFVSHENIRLKIYTPINLWKPWTIQTRLHDKYVIIDDKMYILGGRNTTNLFLGDYQDSKNIDRELLVYDGGKLQPDAQGGQPDTQGGQPDTQGGQPDMQGGESGSLEDLRAYAERVWALPECKEFECGKETEKVRRARRELQDRWPKLVETYPQIMERPDWESMTITVNKVSLLTNPIEAVNKEPEIWYALHRLMLEGKDIIIHTPYIICGKAMYEDLVSLSRTAEQVDIIINDVVSGANPFGCTDYLNERDRILETGVTVHEILNGQSNHTKTILIDDRISIVGSYNLDMRSTYLDTELMLVVDSPELNQMLRELAKEDMSYSKSVTEGRDYEYGENYVPKEFTPLKKAIYSVLRVIIRPIRHLL